MSAIGQLTPFQSMIPPEISYEIFSYLGIKDLGRTEQVCKEWKELASDNRLWKALFEHAYKEQVPTGMLAKDAFASRVHIAIGSEEELGNVVLSFICNLKWDKKRRLECSFSNKPAVIIEQGFGPLRGTKKGFEGPADEIEYCTFTGDLSNEHPYAKMKPIREKIRDGNVPWRGNGVPIYTSLKSPGSNISTIQYGIVCFDADIEGVDVGYGNTLGYYSDTNNWRKPFKFVCLPRTDEAHKWSGRIPYFSSFKFVKIDSAGKVIWETIGVNRFWRCEITRGRSYNAEKWGQYLQSFPVEFPG